MSIKVSSANGMGEATLSGSTITTTGMKAEDHLHVSRGHGTVGVMERDHLKVQEAGTPNMSVDVLFGEGEIPNQAYGESSIEQPKYWNFKSDSTENVTISPADGTNPRYTSIFAKFDTGATPNDEGSNLVTFVSEDGTPAASPTVPGLPDGVNGYLRLADIYVGASVTQITNSNIIDRRVQSSLTARSDGWTNLEDYAAVYVSASSFRVNGTDLTYVLQKGDKIKLTQPTDGVKYFYVKSVSFSTNTTIEIIENDDYDLDNEAIYQVYYSKEESPQGFPSWFNYTPTTGASGSMTWTSVTVDLAMFRIVNKTAHVKFRAFGTTGGSASNGLSFTVPIDNNTAILDDFNIRGFFHVRSAGTWTAGYAINTATPNVFEMQRVDTSNFALGSPSGGLGDVFYAI